MARSDAYADATIWRDLSRGGSGWFRLLDVVPPDDFSTFSVADEIPPVEIPYDGAATWVVSEQQGNPIDPISPDTSGVTVTVVAVAYCMFADEACTLPEWGGRLSDTKITPGSAVVVPPASVARRYPASVASTL